MKIDHQGERYSLMARVSLVLRFELTHLLRVAIYELLKGKSCGCPIR